MGLGPQEAERLQSVARFKSIITLGGKRDAEQLPVGRIIVHDQDVRLHDPDAEQRPCDFHRCDYRFFAGGFSVEAESLPSTRLPLARQIVAAPSQ